MPRPYRAGAACDDTPAPASRSVGRLLQSDAREDLVAELLGRGLLARHRTVSMRTTPTRCSVVQSSQSSMCSRMSAASSPRSSPCRNSSSSAFAFEQSQPLIALPSLRRDPRSRQPSGPVRASSPSTLRPGRCRSHVRGPPEPPEEPATTVQTAHDRPHRCLHDVGDLLVGEPFDIGEVDGHPEVLRDGLQRVLHGGGRQVVDGVGLGGARRDRLGDALRAAELPVLELVDRALVGVALVLAVRVDERVREDPVQQAFRFVPCLNWRNAANALTKVSCTRSDASAGLRVIRIAAPYSWSMNGSAWSSKSPRSSASDTVFASTARRRRRRPARRARPTPRRAAPRSPRRGRAVLRAVRRSSSPPSLGRAWCARSARRVSTVRVLLSPMILPVRSVPL